MGWLAVPIFLLAFCCWLSAAIHAVLLLGHLAPGMSVGKVLFQGYRFYQRETFAPSGHVYHRRFVGSAVAFFLCVLAGVAVAALTAATASGS